MSSEAKLKKGIGLWTLLSIGVGGIIGSGIFILPANMAAIAGPGLLLAILLSGIITTFLALAYAELGAAFPITGGPFSLPRLAMGDLGGFIIGWGYFIYLFVGTAGIIDIFIVYLGFYIPGLSVGATLTPMGIGVALIAVWLFTFINIFGVKWGGLYSLITTIGKLIPLLLFCIMGFVVIDGHNFTPFMPFGLTGVTLASTLFFWSYTGFEAIVVPSEEVINPGRNIPLAMILTMVITIVTYLLVSTAFLGMIDWQGMGTTPMNWKKIGEMDFPLANVALSSSFLKMGWLAIIMAIGAVISTGGSGGTWVLIQGRMPYAMAKEGLFWSRVGTINKYGTPAFSLIFTSVLTSIILILIPHFVSVSLIASITAIVAYSAAVLSLPILRKTKKDTPRPFKLPIHRTFTLVGFIFATWLIYWASWPWTLVGTVLILIGFPVFLLVRTKNLECKRNLWLVVYLIGVVFISFIGDSHFVIDNFTPWVPLGLLTLPYDLVTLALFAIVIYIWSYRVNIKKEMIS
ncbi:MAG: amino acid permease [Simkaniaceae bacterium]|jgi:amino acid transporter|nr:MAG: amino acid permease [Simkaniaceae bacterium]